MSQTQRIAIALRKKFSELDAEEIELLWTYTADKSMEELLALYPLNEVQWDGSSTV